MADIKLGLTLYCFTPEYAKGVLDLEGNNPDCRGDGIYGI